MTEWNTEDIDQFWGLTEELRDAMVQWRNAPSGSTALYAGLCLGQCKLFEVAQSLLRIDDFATESVFVELFYEAWREVRRMTNLINTECDEEGLLQASGGGVEARTLALDVLQSRLLFEGLTLVFDELDRTQNLFSDSAIAQSFRQRLAVYRQLLETLDETIDANPEQMSLVAESTWPHNLRMTLPTQSWQPRPWWLTNYANRLLEDHRKLVQDLSDPQIAGLLIAEPVSSPVVRAPDVVAEPQASIEFALAADNNIAASMFQLAEFQGNALEWNLQSTLHLSADYRNAALQSIPATTKCVGKISIISNSGSEETDDPSQVWRLRWGPIIVDVSLKKLVGLHMNEWFGEYALTAGQLQAQVNNGSWTQQIWRRLG